ncbi:uncharacterized protein [Chironomus tepperi]|uniref:uncharacterized protein n=1 Tax=Chironomus tepperi TaxID=113505 RepID=UPI00391F2C1B
MKETLLRILILGCLAAYVTCDRGLFEFLDSYGRCWRCLPGRSCVRCADIQAHPPVVGPPPWDRSCPFPGNETCAENPGVKFPSLDIRFYYICADEGITLVPCFCDTIFDYESQSCVYADTISRLSCEAGRYECTEMWECGTNLTPPCSSSTPPPPPPTIPTPPSPIPTVDNGITTTTTPPTPTPPPPPTITTEAGGPGATHPGNNPVVPPDATPAPCVCVVWWPCWCNPCWNMPCHSCNGCVGMMG